MAGSRRTIRYEEYAAHGSVETEEIDSGLVRMKITPSRVSTATSAPSEDLRAQRGNASASHQQNDEYMAAFDAAYEDLASKHGKSQVQLNKGTSSPSSSPPAARGIPKEHLVRDHEAVDKMPLPSVARASERQGPWLVGPGQPEGVVHNASAQPIMCMSLNPDHREIVVGSSDHALYTIPVPTSSNSSGASNGGSRTRTSSASTRGRTLYTKKFGHTEWVTCAMYLADNRIVSGGMDSKLCLWDATGVKCEDLMGHSGSVTLVRALTDELVLSASYDKTIRVWNVNRKATSRQRELSTMKIGSAPILDVSVFRQSDNSSAQTVVSGDRDGCVHIADLVEGKITRKFAGAHKGHTTSVLASRVESSALSFTGGQDGVVRVWDLRQKGTIPAHALELHIDRKTGKAGAVGFLLEPGGDDNILLSGGADGSIKVLDKRVSFKTLFNFNEHLDFIYAMHVQDQLCFSGAGNGMLHVHDWKRGKLLYGLGANKAAVRAIETTATHLIAAGDDGSAIFYDMQ